MEPTKSSETSSSTKLSHTPWVNPETKKYHSEHGESFKKTDNELIKIKHILQKMLLNCLRGNEGLLFIFQTVKTWIHKHFSYSWCLTQRNLASWTSCKVRFTATGPTRATTKPTARLCTSSGLQHEIQSKPVSSSLTTRPDRHNVPPHPHFESHVQFGQERIYFRRVLFHSG
jgi:hypothetical protein